jgi:hypothetical protein
MPRSLLRLLAAALWTFGLMAVGSCTKDDIPATPSSPFLFTSVKISKFTSPGQGSTLTANQNYTARFSVNYSLSADEERQKTTIGIFADVYSRNAAGTVTVLASSPTTVPGLTVGAGAPPESLSFTVPVGAKTVVLEAYLDTIPSSGFVISLDSTQSWPVQ